MIIFSRLSSGKFSQNSAYGEKNWMESISNMVSHYFCFLLKYLAQGDSLNYLSLYLQLRPAPLPHNLSVNSETLGPDHSW